MLIKKEDRRKHGKNIMACPIPRAAIINQQGRFYMVMEGSCILAGIELVSPLEKHEGN